MRKEMTSKLLMAGLVAGCTFGASAGSVSSILGSLSDPTDGRNVIFEDTTYSFVTPSFGDGITAADVGEEVFAAFNIQAVGLGGVTTTLDGGNAIVSPPTEFSTIAEDITIEGTLVGEITGVDVVTGEITVGGVTASVFSADFFEDSPVTTRAATEAAFTDLTPAATFGLGDADDFYTINFDPGSGLVTGFSLGLSTIDNFTFPGLIESPLSAFSGGGDADIFASGTVTLPPVGAGTPSGTFVIGDANFSLNTIPSPAAAAFGLFGLLGLSVRRRRS